MMQVIGDVKCYHCGHISGQVVGSRGSRGDRLVLQSFRPRPGYRGDIPGPGDRLLCERCQGPVYLEDLKPLPVEPVLMVETKPKRRSAKTRAA
ncbi:MAG: hypothetical protein HY723_05680 [Chloroflexi bacterium]|nr:hypothetical protein [Chloroflexota bacterium]